MSKQPETLRLADELDAVVTPYCLESKAAAKLRDLYAENELLHQRHHDDNVEYTRVLVQRDALLEALKRLMSEEPTIYEGRLEASLYVTVDALEAARAAIKAVEDKK